MRGRVLVPSAACSKVDQCCGKALAVGFLLKREIADAVAVQIGEASLVPVALA